MPQKKQVKTLRQACLGNIVENMDDYWCRYVDVAVVSSEGRSSVDESPFECLPGTLVLEIMEILKKKHMLEEKHLHFIVTSKIRELDLGCVSVENKETFLLIGRRCKESWKKISLKGFYKFSDFLLEIFQMLASFSALEILNMSQSYVGDEVLSVVASSCPKLRELDLTDCYYVTDEGIEFVFIEKLAENGIDRYGKCKELTTLKLEGTKVTKRGIKLALQHLPRLQRLDHYLIVEVLIEIVKSEKGRMYDLRVISFGWSDRYGIETTFDRSVLSDVVDVCPYINEVHIGRFHGDGLCLRPLAKLQYLKVLDISCDTDYDVQFSDSFSTLLEACGKDIKCLTLDGFKEVEVGIIAKHCPALESLTIAASEFHSYGSSGLCSSPSSFVVRFPCLETFKYETWSWDGCPPMVLNGILSSPKLQTIQIYDCNSLTDALLEEVLREGQRFNHLRQLSLYNCKNITGMFIRTLLLLPGPLKDVTIYFCKGITRDDRDSFVRLISESNLDVNLEYYS